MTDDLWARFGSTFSLTELQCGELRDMIQTERSLRLAACIKIFSDRCLLDTGTTARLIKIIETQEDPASVAAAITALRESNVRSPVLSDAVHLFLNYDRYASGWYDPTIASIEYYLRTSDIDEKKKLRPRFEKLLYDAVAHGDNDLIEYCNSGEAH